MTRKSEHILVVGAGLSGVAAAKYAHQTGALVTLCDDANETQLARKLANKDLPEAIKIVSGPVPHALLHGQTKLILSPGVPRSHQLVQEALRQKMPVLTELDLAAHVLADAKVIGVTGTNGKSTTTTMIGCVLQTLDEGAFVGGNLGTPLCDYALLDKKPHFAVVELSSFQLETLHLLKLDVALATHITPDHLDRYAKVEDYYNAKAKIFDLLKPDGTAVLNDQCSNSRRFFAPLIKNPTIYFNAENNPGVTLDQTDAVLPDGTRISLDSPYIMGRHNLDNAQACVAACFAAGISPENIEKGLRAFRGVPHRLQFLGERAGVKWYNDSKATTVDSTVMALRCFDDVGVHLILGGRGKGLSYQALNEAGQNRIKHIYAIGEEMSAIMRELGQSFDIVQAHTLDKAVAEALARIKAGDVLLLSPACTSYDQYANFEQRGEAFMALFQDQP